MTKKTLEDNLYECLKKGNTKKALYVVALLGDDVNRFCGDKSLLIWAKKFENEDVIHALEKKGAKEIVSKERAQKLGLELIEKIDKGDSEGALDLIEKGANVNVKGKGGYTALIKAASKGNVEVVEKLIETGADVDAKTHQGYTALMCTVSKEVVEKLVNAGADLNLRDNRGETALIKYAYERGGESVKILINAGADLDIQNVYGETALMSALLNNDEENANILVDAGADLNKQRYDSKKCLMETYHLSGADEVEDIINNFCYDSLNDDEMEDMIEAFHDGDLKRAESLLDEFFYEEIISGCDESTALMDAAFHGYTELVEKMIDKGADVTLKDVDGKDVLARAKGGDMRNNIIEAVNRRNGDAKKQPLINPAKFIGRDD